MGIVAKATKGSGSRPLMTNSRKPSCQEGHHLHLWGKGPFQETDLAGRRGVSFILILEDLEGLKFPQLLRYSYDI